jgi:hypothetical protein
MCSSEMVPVVPLELFAALIGGGDLKQMLVIRKNPNTKLHIKDVTSSVPPDSTALCYCNNVTTSVFRVDFYTADRDRIISIFTVVSCILMSSKSFIYQLMHNRVALKEY